MSILERRPARWPIVAAATVILVAAAAVAGWWLLRPFEPVRTTVVQEGLEHPWDIAFAEGGRMLVTERIGRVRVYAGPQADAQLLHTTAISDVQAELESGLMGIAVDGSSVFVCATRGANDPASWQVQLLRATLGSDGSLSPFAALPIGPIRGAPRHQGCAVEVDDAGDVWLTIGDANLPAGENAAQDPDVLNGKVLRVHPDGTVPADNPFGPESPVVSLGHRNPQGLAFGPGGLIVAVEHGTDENDEINVIEPGGNYGYPCFTGADAVGPIPDGCGPATGYLAPAWASGAPTLATSGITFLAGSAWGDREGDLVVTTLKEQDLRRFTIADDGSITEAETLLDGRFGRLRAAVIGPDGALYLSTANGDDRIIRVEPPG
ncbi:MAG TPA: PQQ-dependent sugar dehydrogenase [Patescibacteria group bacterium]|nr:PQQ-dependent sugar dehydrogenase [Patescibacteria group bacterium]